MIPDKADKSKSSVELFDGALQPILGAGFPRICTSGYVLQLNSLVCCLHLLI